MTRIAPAAQGPNMSVKAARTNVPELASPGLASAGGASPRAMPALPDLYARFFRVLGDPTRIRLLQILLDAPTGELRVSELVEALGAPQSRVSTHLGCLRWCGLVYSRREGKQVYYRVADPRVCELLTIGGALLRDHAADVATCGVIG